jgi:hypothetical protein
MYYLPLVQRFAPLNLTFIIVDEGFEAGRIVGIET